MLEKGEKTALNVTESMAGKGLMVQMAGDQDVLMVRRLEFANCFRSRLPQFLEEEDLPETSVELSLSPRGIVVSFLDDVLFPEGEATLPSRARAVLRSSGEIIRKSHYHVIVEGHVGPELIGSSTHASAWDVSLARASAVLNFLVRDVRFPPHRLAIAAYGDMKPLFPNDTPAHRRHNQRVELVLYEPEGKAPASH